MYLYIYMFALDVHTHNVYLHLYSPWIRSNVCPKVRKGMEVEPLAFARRRLDGLDGMIHYKEFFMGI